MVVEIRRNTERGHVSEPAGARKSVACHRRQRDDRRIEAWGMKRRGRTVSHVPYYGIFVRITVKLCRHVQPGRSAGTLRCTYSRENEGPLTASQGRVRGRLARGGGFPGDSATGRGWWRPGEVREVWRGRDERKCFTRRGNGVDLFVRETPRPGTIETELRPSEEKRKRSRGSRRRSERIHANGPWRRGGLRPIVINELLIKGEDVDVTRRNADMQKSSVDTEHTLPSLLSIADGYSEMLRLRIHDLH